MTKVTSQVKTIGGSKEIVYTPKPRDCKTKSVTPKRIARASCSNMRLTRSMTRYGVPKKENEATLIKAPLQSPCSSTVKKGRSELDAFKSDHLESKDKTITIKEERSLSPLHSGIQNKNKEWNKLRAKLQNHNTLSDNTSSGGQNHHQAPKMTEGNQNQITFKEIAYILGFTTETPTQERISTIKPPSVSLVHNQPIIKVEHVKTEPKTLALSSSAQGEQAIKTQPAKIDLKSTRNHIIKQFGAISLTDSSSCTSSKDNKTSETQRSAENTTREPDKLFPEVKRTKKERRPSSTSRSHKHTIKIEDNKKASKNKIKKSEHRNASSEKSNNTHEHRNKSVQDNSVKTPNHFSSKIASHHHRSRSKTVKSDKTYTHEVLPKASQQRNICKDKEFKKERRERSSNYLPTTEIRDLNKSSSAEVEHRLCLANPYAKHHHGSNSVQLNENDSNTRTSSSNLNDHLGKENIAPIGNPPTCHILEKPKYKSRWDSRSPKRKTEPREAPLLRNPCAILRNVITGTLPKKGESKKHVLLTKTVIDSRSDSQTSTAVNQVNNSERVTGISSHSVPPFKTIAMKSAHTATAVDQVNETGRLTGSLSHNVPSSDTKATLSPASRSKRKNNSHKSNRVDKTEHIRKKAKSDLLYKSHATGPNHNPAFIQNKTHISSQVLEPTTNRHPTIRIDQNSSRIATTYAMKKERIKMGEMDNSSPIPVIPIIGQDENRSPSPSGPGPIKTNVNVIPQRVANPFSESVLKSKHTSSRDVTNVIPSRTSPCHTTALIVKEEMSVGKETSSLDKTQDLTPMKMDTQILDESNPVASKITCSTHNTDSTSNSTIPVIKNELCKIDSGTDTYSNNNSEQSIINLEDSRSQSPLMIKAETCEPNKQGNTKGSIHDMINGIPWDWNLFLIKRELDESGREGGSSSPREDVNKTSTETKSESMETDTNVVPQRVINPFHESVRISPLTAPRDEISVIPTHNPSWNTTPLIIKEEEEQHNSTNISTPSNDETQLFIPVKVETLIPGKSPTKCDEINVIPTYNPSWNTTALIIKEEEEQHNSTNISTPSNDETQLFIPVKVKTLIPGKSPTKCDEINVIPTYNPSWNTTALIIKEKEEQHNSTNISTPSNDETQLFIPVKVETLIPGKSPTKCDEINVIPTYNPSWNTTALIIKEEEEQHNSTNISTPSNDETQLFIPVKVKTLIPGKSPTKCDEINVIPTHNPSWNTTALIIKEEEEQDNSTNISTPSNDKTQLFIPVKVKTLIPGKSPTKSPKNTGHETATQEANSTVALINDELCEVDKRADTRTTKTCFQDNGSQPPIVVKTEDSEQENISNTSQDTINGVPRDINTFPVEKRLDKFGQEGGNYIPAQDRSPSPLGYHPQRVPNPFSESARKSSLTTSIDVVNVIPVTAIKEEEIAVEEEKKPSSRETTPSVNKTELHIPVKIETPTASPTRDASAPFYNSTKSWIAHRADTCSTNNSEQTATNKRNPLQNSESQPPLTIKTEACEPEKQGNINNLSHNTISSIPWDLNLSAIKSELDNETGSSAPTTNTNIIPEQVPNPFNKSVPRIHNKNKISDQTNSNRFAHSTPVSRSTNLKKNICNKTSDDSSKVTPPMEVKHVRSKPEKRKHKPSQNTSTTAEKRARLEDSENSETPATVNSKMNEENVPPLTNDKRLEHQLSPAANQKDPAVPPIEKPKNQDLTVELDKDISYQMSPVLSLNEMLVSLFCSPHPAVVLSPDQLSDSIFIDHPSIPTSSRRTSIIQDTEVSTENIPSILPVEETCIPNYLSCEHDTPHRSMESKGENCSHRHKNESPTPEPSKQKSIHDDIIDSTITTAPEVLIKSPVHDDDKPEDNNKFPPTPGRSLFSHFWFYKNESPPRGEEIVPPPTTPGRSIYGDLWFYTKED